jgi:Arc/MetJ-type ribon-helix-helix transcriptional regulator
MNRLEISLPDHVKAVADECLARGGYANYSEYVCRLIEEDAQRRAAQGQLEAMLVSRLEDDQIVEMNKADLQQMRGEFLRRVGH